MNLPTTCYDHAKIRLIEHTAINDYQITTTELMQRAGQAAFNCLTQRFPNAKTIIVICGKGNNGGDGYVLARLSAQIYPKVKVFHVDTFPPQTHEAQAAALQCQAAGISITPFVEMEANELLNADVIVDAILGIGLTGDLNAEYLTIINQINDSKNEVFALDIPSGLHADTGNTGGAAIKATATISFLGLKPGLFTADGLIYAGEIFYDNLNLPAEIFTKIEPSVTRISYSDLSVYLKPRLRNAHKGHFGHVLIIGGDYGMPGAVRLAAEACARTGAGLTTVATRPEHVAIVTSQRPELMCFEVMSRLDLQSLINKATVIVIGPGLGRSGWASELLECVLTCKCPLIVDADALNLMAERNLRPNENWILTPHPGEAARLLHTTAQNIQADRFHAAAQLHQRFGGVIVLKGAGTIIHGPSHGPALCSAGNPGMASGGMGDVLSGVIGGLVAQGFATEIAARLGVCLHACAADTACQNGERGLLAADLMPYIHQYANPHRN